MSEDKTCADCGGKLELGFIPDATYGAIMQTSWHAGKPKESTLFGMKTGGINVNVLKTRAVTAYRCTECGLLKLYAGEMMEQG